MPIEWRDSGSIFDEASPRSVLVCPTNCIPGVMGAGLAKLFAARWPDLIGEHRAACRSGELAPGKVKLVYRGDGEQPVMFFPTKDDWRKPSELRWIYLGLADLARWLDLCPRGMFVLPALGCGHGGLRWEDVRPLIAGMAAAMDYHEFVVYGPGPKAD